ncbi:MAG: thiol-disulfide oxidoreductase DCC family protein [Rhodothermales bacterium]|nr:thiol-disulfide oxidoreductase DCC family protein [Rhodothermales bacterium]
MRTAPHPIILFDGVCNLCNASVNFVLDRDPGTFRFGSLQSPEGQALMAEVGYSDERMGSIVLVEGGNVLTESDAVLRIAGRLQGPARLLRLFRVVPRWIRDPVYRLVSRNRYRWFGRRDVCRIPTPDLKDRFIDG